MMASLKEYQVTFLTQHLTVGPVKIHFHNMVSIQSQKQDAEAFTNIQLWLNTFYYG